MFRTRAISVLVSGVVLATLAPASVLAQDTAEPVTEAAVLEGTEWSLTRFTDVEGMLVDVPAGVSAGLLLSDGTASGSAGCNTFSTSYVVDGSSLTIGGEDGAMALTQALCEGDPQVVEDAYVASLPQVATWAIADGILELADADGTVVLGYGTGIVPVAVADYLAMNEQLAAQAAAIVDLTARVADLEGTGGETTGPTEPTEPTEPEVTDPPKGPRVDKEIERKFAELQVEEDRGLIEWVDRADDEDGFNIHARRIQCVLRKGDPTERPSDWVRIARLPADTESYVPVHAEIVEQIEPQNKKVIGRGSLYEVAVSAFNDAGRSKRKVAGAYILAPEYGCP